MHAGGCRCLPHPKFPLALLQMCTEVTNEPPQGMRARLVRSYNVMVDQDKLERQTRRKHVMIRAHIHTHPHTHTHAHTHTRHHTHHHPHLLLAGSRPVIPHL